MNKDRNTSIQHLELSSDDLEVLKDIREFLLIPHRTQELVSAEKTPTLSIAIPAYEKLLHLFKLFKATKPRIAHAVDASIEKLEGYLEKARKNPIYSIAMSVYDLFNSTYFSAQSSTQSYIRESNYNGSKNIGVQMKYGPHENLCSKL